jgi:uncharacterized protein YegL
MKNKVKTKEEMIASFKRLNKVARLVKANKEGYSTWESYLAFLEGTPRTTKVTSSKKETIVQKVVKVVTGKRSKKNSPTIHVVDIIDCSGSMGGDKIKAALLGINTGIQDLQKQKDVKYTYTLCEFASVGDMNFPHVKSSIDTVKTVKFNARGMTALYDAIGETLKTMCKGLDSNDKVLVNIYTDGQENNSKKWDEKEIAEEITRLQKKNFTITFIGTEMDVKQVVRDLKISKSNTLSYDGTAQGLSKSLNQTVSARATYSAAVLDGLDVSTGFYKDIKE